MVGHGPDHQISPREGVVGRHLDIDGPILSPKTYNANYLENQYKKIELREQAEVLKAENKGASLRLEAEERAKLLSSAGKSQNAKEPLPPEIEALLHQDSVPNV